MSTLDIVRREVGRRTKITREEMAALLRSLAAAGLDLRNGYVVETINLVAQDAPLDRVGSARAAAAWARLCDGICCISVDARGGLRDGDVRYDEPGRMDPNQRAEVTFCPADIDAGRSDGGSTVAYMRRHAERVLLVIQT
jgi:hypothetical protein